MLVYAKGGGLANFYGTASARRQSIGTTKRNTDRPLLAGSGHLSVRSFVPCPDAPLTCCIIRSARASKSAGKELARFFCPMVRISLSKLRTSNAVSESMPRLWRCIRLSKTSARASRSSSFGLISAEMHSPFHRKPSVGRLGVWPASCTVALGALHGKVGKCQLTSAWQVQRQLIVPCWDWAMESLQLST